MRPWVSGRMDRASPQVKVRHVGGLWWVAAALNLGACATAEAIPRGAPIPPSEWPISLRTGLDIFREVIAVDASRRWSRQGLFDRLANALKTETISVVEKRGVLVARLKASEQGEKRGPLLLFAHIDTWASHPAAWPDRAGPRSARVIDNALYGRGVLGGKGAAALFVASLRTLSQEMPRLERPVWLVITPDGLNPKAPTLERVFRSYPELARTVIALGPGGGILRLPGGQPDIHFVDVGEQGYADVLLTAVGSKAPVRLAKAIARLPEALPRPAPGPSAYRYLEDVAAFSSWPDRWLMRAKPLVRLFYTERLADAPWTRNLVVTEARVSFVSKPAGATLGADTRARARIQVHLVGSETPAGLRARLRARLGQTVYVDLAGGEPPAQGEAPPQKSTDRLARAFGGERWTRTLGPPTQARLLVRIGIPSFGHIPLVLEPRHLHSRAGPAERVPLEGLRSALESLPRNLRRLASTATTTLVSDR